MIFKIQMQMLYVIQLTFVMFAGAKSRGGSSEQEVVGQSGGAEHGFLRLSSSLHCRFFVLARVFLLSYILNIVYYVINLHLGSSEFNDIVCKLVVKKCGFLWLGLSWCFAHVSQFVHCLGTFKRVGKLEFIPVRWE